MSRIYNNLKPVNSRSVVCITERNLGNQTHGEGMIKIRPGGQFAHGARKIQTESSLQSAQNQVEQLCIKKPEDQKIADGEALENVCQHQKHQAHKPSLETEVQTLPMQMSTSVTKSINSQPEATVTTPSTALFTIRSASGGKGKKGTTFTVTPRKLSTPSSPVTTPKAPLTPSTASNAPSYTPELNKKRYPTAEEIEVLGGYQKLERSCLVKNRGSPKTVRVSFDESRVRVCTYLSEASLVSEGDGSDDWRTEEKQEDADEEADVNEVTGAGRGLSRVLRVDESCHR